ncbi:Pr6Pr family membrane protein [Demequina salsinemoris]|uniref:Pr6Pr family membrane protein n=1 Tax=Demequina salsinemoris TaxID=577470 RepID=UPI0007866846|nr:Pr6Pr family membrane protein [Demequina salsinemoris]
MQGIWSRVQLAGAVTIFAALAATTLSVIQAGEPTLVNLFSYFTIQANALGMVTLLVSGVRRSEPRANCFECARAAATTYVLLVVGIYWTMLADAGFALPEAWSNAILHGIAAAILLADWVMDPPRTPMTWRKTWTLVAYPALYAVVALIRGATDGWVPYPFLDPSRGYASVLATCVAMLAVVLLIGAGLVQIARWRMGSRESLTDADPDSDLDTVSA